MVMEFLQTMRNYAKRKHFYESIHEISALCGLCLVECIIANCFAFGILAFLLVSCRAQYADQSRSLRMSLLPASL